jgi:hypothetical protein
VFILASSAASQAGDIIVTPRSPAGEAAGGALEDLVAARDAARRQPAGERRRIILQAGTYRLTGPLVLEPADSGLTFEAAAAGQVTLSGGRPITGWKAEGRFWSAEVPEVRAGRWDFRMLIVNGRFAPRARLPEEGAFKNLNEYKVPGPDEPKRKPDPDQLLRMTYRPEDLGPWLDIRNAELTVFHAWDESLVGLAARDVAAHVLTFANPASYPPGSFNNPDYVVWNVREGLKRPGQWYLDRTAGKVVYYPMAGEELARVEAFAPAAESLITMNGSSAGPVRDITLRGFRLTLTGSRLARGFFGARNVSSAVSLQSTRNCRLERLEFADLAGHAVKGEHGDATVIGGCDFHALGGGAVILDGNDCTTSGSSTPAGWGCGCSAPTSCSGTTRCTTFPTAGSSPSATTTGSSPTCCTG